VPIPVSDGTVLRGNLFLPAAQGRFPTALTVTGYNKDVDNPFGTSCRAGAGITSADPALVEAGYAVLVVDDRGTGASGGTWDSWGQRTQDDYTDVLDWLAAQPWSDGSAGTTGGSYMGITSLLVAQADAARVRAGKPRVVKAVWADVPMADAYRDVTFHGGATDSGFIPLWLGLVNALSALPPSTTASDPGSAAPAWLQRLPGNAGFAANNVASAALGEDAAFDGPFYRLRSPGERAHELEIPVAWTGGWFDIFQRGEPLLYELLKNVPTKKFWMTPTYHTSGNEIFEKQGIGSTSEIRRKWFDRWIKGTRNGVEDLAPVNLFTMGADRWQHLPSWPVPNTAYTRFHLAGDRALSTAKPGAAGGDTTPLLPASSPCSRLTAQWTAGTGAAGPCETDNRTFESTALTYTTPELRQDTEVTGVISANVWATLTRPDATLIAVVSDVAPDGTSTQLTAGFLQASQRATDDARSTKGPGGVVIRPFHPYTREAARPVTPNEPSLYRVEIYPTSNVFKAGHRIRLTLSTANTPTTAPSTPALADQAGGSIRVLRGGRYDSHLLLPLRDAAAAAGITSLPASRSCRSRRDFVIRVRQRRGLVLERVTVLVNGRRTRVLRGRRLRARVKLTGLPRGTFRVRVVVRGRRAGKRFTVRDTRTYRTCVPRRRGR
jgi:putative CocE/NonD family hydrolase